MALQDISVLDDWKLFDMFELLGITVLIADGNLYIKVLESNPCLVNLGDDRATATALSLITLVIFSVRL